MNTHEHWWHMFCTNVSTKVEVVNLENDEIKSVLVMLVASYFLNIWWLLETNFGIHVCIYKNFAVSCHFIQVQISIFNFSICQPYVRASLEWCNLPGKCMCFLKIKLGQPPGLSSGTLESMQPITDLRDFDGWLSLFQVDISWSCQFIPINKYKSTW